MLQFDLQQVILLPIAADSKLFYHRRLTHFNLTIYDVATRDCSCYVWHEGLGKRGSCEIATCLYKYLNNLYDKNVKEVFLLSDGCCGQNKNSAIATRMLHIVSNSKNLKSISLKFLSRTTDKMKVIRTQRNQFSNYHCWQCYGAFRAEVNNKACPTKSPLRCQKFRKYRLLGLHGFIQVTKNSHRAKRR